MRAAAFREVAILMATALLALPAAPAEGADRGREYKGPNRILSFAVPRAPNWAGLPYKVTALDTKGDPHYDKVMLHVDDFGQYLVAGARIMPAPAVAAMDADEPGAVLRNLSEATLMAWRTDLEAVPQVLQERNHESPHGDALVRVYRAEKGSLLRMAQGRRPTPDDAFDTNVASVVARRGPVVVFVLAQDDLDAQAQEALMVRALKLFDELQVTATR